MTLSPQECVEARRMLDIIEGRGPGGKMNHAYADGYYALSIEEKFGLSIEKLRKELKMNDRDTPPPPEGAQPKSWSVHDEMLYTSLPEHIRPGLVRYVDEGIATGGFLEAVLTNDLFLACAKADDVNRYALWNIVNFISDVVPQVCRGSKNDFRTWVMMSDQSRERSLFGARRWAIFKEWYDEQEPE